MELTISKYNRIFTIAIALTLTGICLSGCTDSSLPESVVDEPEANTDTAPVVLAKNKVSEPEQQMLQATAAMPDNPVLTPNAIPFTLSITPKVYDQNIAPLPGMQSAVIAAYDGKWLLFGGRTQGLHTFFAAPKNNFPVKQANSSMWVIDPVTGEQWQLDLASLPVNLKDPLTSTNQLAYFDRNEKQLYVAGGYGWDSVAEDMDTFDSMIRIPVDQAITLIMSDKPAEQKIQELESLIQQSKDPRFAVTGGELRRINGNFYLVFGQNFKGQYHAFGSGTNSGNPAFVQTYTEEIRVFTLNPNTLDILSYGPLISSDPSRPYHRRDGVIVDDIDPKTGQPRVSAFGGVFQVGKTVGYGSPVYITDNDSAPAAFVDDSVSQKFSQYQCPTVSVFDDKNNAVYHTFYGGLSEHYFNQSAQQSKVFDIVVEQNRADGVPFINDITTLVQKANGDHAQYILPDPIPQVAVPASITDNLPPPYNNFDTGQVNMFGTSANFILDPELIASGKAYENGVLKLSAFEHSETTTLGYFFGGIASFFPYALVPNTGTYASNTVFEIQLNTTPASAYSADFGVRAISQKSGQ